MKGIGIFNFVYVRPSNSLSVDESINRAVGLSKDGRFLLWPVTGRSGTLTVYTVQFFLYWFSNFVKCHGWISLVLTLNLGGLLSFLKTVVS